MGIFDIITQPYNAASSALSLASGWYNRRKEAAEKRQSEEKANQQYILDRRAQWKAFADSQKAAKVAKKAEALAQIVAKETQTTAVNVSVAYTPVQTPPVMPPTSVTHSHAPLDDTVTSLQNFSMGISPHVQPSVAALEKLEAVKTYWGNVEQVKSVKDVLVRFGERDQLQKKLWESACLTSAPAAIKQDRNDFRVHKKTLEGVLKTSVKPFEERAPLFSTVARHGKDITAGAMGFSFGSLVYASVVAHYYQQGVQHLLSSSYGIRGQLASVIQSSSQWAVYSADFAPAFSQSLVAGLATIPVALAGIALINSYKQEKDNDVQLSRSRELASQGLEAVRDHAVALSGYKNNAEDIEHKSGLVRHGPINVNHLDTLSDSVQTAIESAVVTATYRQAVGETHSPTPQNQKMSYFSGLKLSMQRALVGAYSPCASACQAFASVLL